MALTLYTDEGNFRAFKIIIAAEYNEVALVRPPFKMLQDNLTEDFRRKSPLGKVPVLETPQGSIFESNAIARYVARIRRDTELYGVSFFDSAQVDSWIDFCSHEIELPATMWLYPIFGYMPYNAAATAKAKESLSRSLAILDQYLLDKTYLVGEKITLADITVVSALVYPFKFVASPEYRAPFVNVLRWFETCVNQPQFQRVVGTVVLCVQEMTADGSAPLPTPVSAPVSAPASAPSAEAASASQGKKEKKKKEKTPKAEGEAPAPKEKKQSKPKEPEPKDDDDDLPDYAKEEKKEDHPLKILDATSKSPFVGDVWKKIYSNTEDYADAMRQFWEMFDADGWSLWQCEYNYNNENNVLFMTSNLVSGFIQRSGEIRKWLFGVMHITQAEKPFKVRGLYLIRGQEIQPLITANDDAEYYTWTKIAVPVSDEDKAKVAAFWCSDVGTLLEGEPIQDCKVFK